MREQCLLIPRDAYAYTRNTIFLLTLFHFLYMARYVVLFNYYYFIASHVHQRPPQYTTYLLCIHDTPPPPSFCIFPIYYILYTTALRLEFVSHFFSFVLLSCLRHVYIVSCPPISFSFILTLTSCKIP